MVTLCILDGFGYSEKVGGNAIKLQGTPNLDKLNKYPHTLIKASGSNVLYVNLSGDLKLPNTEFIVKDGLYKFDYEKLKGIVQKHLQGIKDYQRKNSYTEVEVESETVGELESYLLELEVKCGDNKAAFRNILISAFSATEMSADEMKETMYSITKKNRERYATILGYKL